MSSAPYQVRGKLQRESPPPYLDSASSLSWRQARVRNDKISKGQILVGFGDLA
ncbi:MAG: hypothetical protein Q8O55_09680 [Dehalococcoidales bacterium]|nr:hypothetical protein [Dehalococcoidales bacterium]